LFIHVYFFYASEHIYLSWCLFWILFRVSPGLPTSKTKSFTLSAGFLLGNFQVQKINQEKGQIRSTSLIQIPSGKRLHSYRKSPCY
jgi:hypothetical protein